MFLGTKKRPASDAVPLQKAVLCVDCESVSYSRGDECPVCRSHSIFRIAPVLGGSLLTQKVNAGEPDGTAVRFDLEITIALKQLTARDVNATLNGITCLIAPAIEQAQASLHIDVVPVTRNRRALREAV